MHERHATPDQTLVDEIFAAKQVLSRPDSPVLGTELTYDEALSERYDADVWLASELHQPIGAYKIRGAYNFVHNMTAAERQRGVVTASAGNHGQGVALSSNRAGIDSHIFMPETTPDLKVGKVAELGGVTTRITLAGSTFDECEALAKEYCHDTGAVFAHPFNDRRVIAGQGTWGVEIASALPNVDKVLCPVGGMGLMAGTSTAIKHVNPAAEIIGIEPAGAASLRQALRNGTATPLENSIDTSVDGAAVKKVGQLPFSLASQLVESVVTVSNAELRRSTTELWEREKPLRAELAGALSVAGLQKLGHIISGHTVVCMITGGNLSQERYDQEVRVRSQQRHHSLALL